MKYKKGMILELNHAFDYSNAVIIGFDSMDNKKILLVDLINVDTWETDEHKPDERWVYLDQVRKIIKK